MSQKTGLSSKGSLSSVFNQFRRAGKGGKILVSAEIIMLGLGFVWKTFQAIQHFDGFIPENNPNGIRDSGVIEVDGQSIRWKIRSNNSLGTKDFQNGVLFMTVVLQSEWKKMN